MLLPSIPGTDPDPGDEFILSAECPPESRARIHSLAAINRQQKSLLKDPRVSAQLARFKSAQHASPATYYSALAPIGIEIIEQGQPAQTANTDPDFVYGDCTYLEIWLTHRVRDRLFLLRDNNWINTRPPKQGSTVLKELRATTTKPLLIEVQELGKHLVPTENSVVAMPIDEVMQRFAAPNQYQAPINLLSLQCKDDGIVPWPLAKHCNLLNQAAAAVSSSSQSSLISTPGKQTTDVISKYVDLQSCMHFQIFGQAGAISTWHMDSIGPYTWITLEPNVLGRPDEDVLKLWAYVRTDNLPVEEQREIRRRFVEEAGAFQPKPEHIKIISLVADDTLIMPPGTIHAPITITDCLFRGGMVMQKCEMRRSIEAWRFCSDNGQCTNENQPKQARSVLDFFTRLVEQDPKSCGYDFAEIPAFREDVRAIGGESMSCKCENPCVKSKCNCAKNTQRCGSRCHGGSGKCNNPFGCEADVI
jgi:hypothetical protein